MKIPALSRMTPEDARDYILEFNRAGSDDRAAAEKAPRMAVVGIHRLSLAHGTRVLPRNLKFYCGLDATLSSLETFDNEVAEEAEFAGLSTLCEIGTSAQFHKGFSAAGTPIETITPAMLEIVQAPSYSAKQIVAVTPEAVYWKFTNGEQVPEPAVGAALRLAAACSRPFVASGLLKKDGDGMYLDIDSILYEGTDGSDSDRLHSLNEIRSYYEAARPEMAEISKTRTPDRADIEAVATNSSFRDYINQAAEKFKKLPQWKQDYINAHYLDRNPEAPSH